ncbi:outer membrane protein assembly factor BamA [Permianibacter sp. IMCC34836]|uniref:outer membrane protein assembly factor BamA n=1 Tax=Permianibacter fluminis TaxID=2738515 RepID=UPI001556DA4A|nr:outer membrane protein assembly factor BamA [Permianibacter fluminis]NQD38685.1 outer membrane protein assembly factor BamA [Permianibacter fluminis]
MKIPFKRLSLAVLLALGATRVLAIEPFVVQDIEVRGLQRVELGTFFTYLPLRVGETIDDTRVPQIIRTLYKQGSFESVKLERDGNKLVVVIEERPTISTIVFDGNKQIKTEQLLEGLKPMGFAKGEVLNPSMLAQIVQELEQQYFSHGKYSVRITHKVVKLPRNRVDVRFKVVEGDAAVIGAINIVGNQVFSDEELLKQFELTTGGWFSFFTDDNQYAKEKLSGDLEKLRSYYMDRGYLKFQVSSTQVAISPDRQQIYITININEGEQYKIKDIKFVGDLIVTEEQLRQMLPAKSGDIYSAAAFTFAETNISKLLGLYGYAFANVTTAPTPDDQNKEVDVTLMIQPGKRTYVRRISFSGNETTNDHVLRREMRMMESGPFSTDLVDRSKTLLERQPFIEEVTIETPKVEGTDDQVDVDVKVKERNAGTFNAGFGYSDFYGLQFTAGISHENFLGSGNKVAFNLSNSKAIKSYDVSFTDPYFTVDGVSLGTRVYFRETDYGELNLVGQALDSVGTKVTLGIPYSEVSRFSIGVGFQDSTFQTGGATSVLQLQEFFQRADQDISVEPDFDYSYLTLELGWLRNTLNRGIFPDRGTSQSFSVEASVPNSDFQFYKAQYDLQHYIQITDGWSFLVRGNLAYGDGYGDGVENYKLPYFENFYAGGQGTVRGFERNTIGPREIIRTSRTSGTPPGTDPGDIGVPVVLPPEFDRIQVGTRGVGGNARALAGMELIFPTPFADGNRSVRTSLFVDAGHLWDTEFDRTHYSFLQTDDYEAIPDYSDSSQFRVSYGLALQWLSPMGPIGFHFSRALRKEDGDNTENFGFTIGRTF